MAVFIISSHYKTNIQCNGGFAKIELLVFILALGVHLTMSGIAYADFELGVRTTLIGLTAIFGILFPMIAFLLPATHRVLAILAILISLPFSWIGLTLSIFGIIHTWFFIIYFTVPLIVSTPCMILSIKAADRENERKQRENERKQNKDVPTMMCCKSK